jgi:hypothetical protein
MFRQLAIVGRFFGLHSWRRKLTCAVCGQPRSGTEPQHHACHACVCPMCGQPRPDDDPSHDWDGCQCRNCRGSRLLSSDSDGHVWQGCHCLRCGADRHDWDDGEREECSDCGGDCIEPGGTFPYDIRECRTCNGHGELRRFRCKRNGCNETVVRKL